MNEVLALTQRLCPGCSEDRPQPTRFFSNPRAEQVPVAKLRDDWRGFFKDKVFFSYSRCAACGLLYCPRFLAPSSLSELYSAMGDNTAGVTPHAVSRTQGGYFELVGNGWKSGDYLEVGPDIGLFTALASRERPQARLFLFEPNRAVWPQLRSACADPARVAISEAMEDLSAVPDRSIGLAVMVHVLDHMMSPVEYLRALERKMTPGGGLLVVVHNEMSLLAKIFGARYPIFCLQHPQLFSPRSLAGLLRKAGFGAARIVRTKNYFPIETLARHLLFQLALNPERAPRVQTLIGLRLGNMAAVVGTDGRGIA